MQTSFSILQPDSDAPSLHAKCEKPSGLGFNIMKDIPKYEGFYKIDETGDAYSLPRNGTKNLIRKLKRNNKKFGYQQYLLQKNGHIKGCLIHRLVAVAFLPNPHNKPFVNHIDGVKSNNNVANLEWVTQSENEKHAHKIGLKNFKGDNATYKKITSKIADKIREDYLNKAGSQRKLAKVYGLSQFTISSIILRKSWK